MAEQPLYSTDSLSIVQNYKNPKLFTNRAMARIKLQLWDGCIDDCLKCIELDQNNMKGYYYLAQAQLALKHPNEALSSALTAYHQCLKQLDPSTKSVSGLVLQAKKEKWEAKERQRIRRRSELLCDLEDAIQRKQAFELQKIDMRYPGREDSTDAREEREDVETSTQYKMEELQNIFAISDPEFLQRRVRTGLKIRG